MGEHTQAFPYKKLGAALRKKREAVHESLAEVSGAVEIDVEMLTKIEQGILLPSEDILLLLISHLSFEEEEATKLWDLAGYEERKNLSDTVDGDSGKQMFMVIPFDNRVMYSDNIEITTNKYGVVLNFIQSGNAQPTTVSRIGMSREHAENMLKVLKTSLSQKEEPQRMLPKPKVDKHESWKSHSKII